MELLQNRSAFVTLICASVLKLKCNQKKAEISSYLLAAHFLLRAMNHASSVVGCFPDLSPFYCSSLMVSGVDVGIFRLFVQPTFQDKLKMVHIFGVAFSLFMFGAQRFSCLQRYF